MNNISKIFIAPFKLIKWWINYTDNHAIGIFIAGFIFIFTIILFGMPEMPIGYNIFTSAFYAFLMSPIVCFVWFVLKLIDSLIFDSLREALRMEKEEKLKIQSTFLQSHKAS